MGQAVLIERYTCTQRLSNALCLLFNRIVFGKASLFRSHPHQAIHRKGHCMLCIRCMMHHFLHRKIGYLEAF